MAHAAVMNKADMVSILLIFGVILLVFVATSCSTVRGVGRDISHVGNDVEHAAR